MFGRRKKDTQISYIKIGRTNVRFVTEGRQFYKYVQGREHDRRRRSDVALAAVSSRRDRTGMSPQPAPGLCTVIIARDFDR